MIGRSSPNSSRSVRQISNPLMSGRKTSSRTSAGRSARAAARASSPVPASSVVGKPARDRSTTMYARKSASSSTTSIGPQFGNLTRLSYPQRDLFTKRRRTAPCESSSPDVLSALAVKDRATARCEEPRPPSSSDAYPRALFKHCSPERRLKRPHEFVEGRSNASSVAPDRAGAELTGAGGTCCVGREPAFRGQRDHRDSH